MDLLPGCAAMASDAWENMYMITDLPERKLSVSRRNPEFVTCTFIFRMGKPAGAMVDMGVPRLNAHSIPILSEKDLVINDPIEVQKKNYRMTGISMGNPHAVIFSEEINGISLEETGRELEFHPRFPERANIEFCHVTARDRMEIRVWERGVGETLACGTGACAAVVASVLNDLTDEEVIVKLLGGELSVRWDRKVNHVFLEGPAVKVFDGVL